MILYNLVVAPIEMIVDWVFTFFSIKFDEFGIIGAVLGVSLVINFLALPIYNVADRLQEKERKIAKSMEGQIKRIKQTSKGDERFMVLQAYYHECNYNPVYTLRSSLSILIEIPFFIAAYHYLSHAEALKGVSFWIFKDLGAADSLFHIGSFPINVLPILMTVINLVSGAIYSKDTTLREKIQIYVLAAIFLVLLYNSPSGLVIYWILNNLFSLAKNIVMKMKNPRRVLLVIVDAILGLFACYFLFFNDGALKKRLLLAIFAVAVILFPVLKQLFARHCEFAKKDCRVKHGNDINNEPFNDINNGYFNANTVSCSGLNRTSSKSQFALFIFSALGLALLCGFYLPSSTISTSPAEFSFLGKGADSPLTYVWSSLFAFLGFFTLWPTLIYFMFGEKVKKWESAIFFVAFFVALADVFIFKADYGAVDVLFQVERKNGLLATKMQILLPPILFLILFVLFIILRKIKKLNITAGLIFAVCLAETILGFSNVSSISKKYVAYKKTKQNDEISANGSENEIKPIYHLSKNGKNVIVLFLDRAVNSFFPNVLNELPDLKKQMPGFVYYPNTLSFSTNTIISSPAMMGGYEYSPENMNKNGDKNIGKKFAESSLLLPNLFSEKGYEITLSDSPYFDSVKSTIKNDYRALKTSGKFSEKFQNDIGMTSQNMSISKSVQKEIRNFSVIQIMLPSLRKTFNGEFRQQYKFANDYLDSISSLFYLNELTDFAAEKNQYLFLGSEITHQAVFLEDDFLTPSKNSNYNGTYETKDERTKKCYMTTLAAFKQLGKYFEFLQENGTYNNTRIIIVADHGYDLPMNIFEDFTSTENPSYYCPLLLFKDFNSTSEISTDNTFMTNADTIFLAKKDLNLADENPFTHKKLAQQKQDGITLYPIIKFEETNESCFPKTQFTLDKNQAYHVSDNIFDEKNWIPLLDWEKQ